jgi:hypothetical protein
LNPALVSSLNCFKNKDKNLDTLKKRLKKLIPRYTQVRPKKIDLGFGYGFGFMHKTHTYPKYPENIGLAFRYISDPKPFGPKDEKL